MMLLLWPIVLYWVVNSVFATDCSGIHAVQPQCDSNESAHKRDVFWVGGTYVNAAIGLPMYDQMYVEKLTPQTGIKQQYPLVFFHGGGVSGGVSWIVKNEWTNS